MLKIKKLKNKFMIVSLLMVEIATCQTPILPLSTYDHIPNGSYLKDVDNQFLNYLGTWEGVLNNKKYTFEIIKFTSRYDTYNLYYQDELMCKFKVTDLTTGIILYNDLNVTNYGDYKIQALPPPKRGMLQFIFTDTVENCNNMLEFYLRDVIGQPNKLTYCYFRYSEDWGMPDSNCSDYEDRLMIPVFLPQQDLILNRL